MMNKKYNEMNIAEMLETLQEARNGVDLMEISKLLWAIGNSYLNEGKFEKVLLYLNLFDDLVGSDDDLYTAFKEQDDEAAKLIEDLANKPSFVKEITDLIEEKGEELTDMKKIQWSILSMARMNWLYEKLSKMEGFEFFSDYEEVVNILAQGIYCECYEDELEMLDEFLENAEEIENFDLYNINNKISMKAGADYEAIDISGINLVDALYGIIDYLQDDEDAEISLDVISDTLHKGYFVRAYETSMYDIPELIEEKERILEDYKFIMEEPDDDDFFMKVESYLAFNGL